MKPLSDYLSTHETEAIDCFVEKLWTEFGRDIEDVRLFGSKARGEAAADSDLDLLILVTSTDYALKHAILWLAAEISLTYDVLLSPRVVPNPAWQQMSQGNTSFYRAVCIDGIPLLAEKG